ncbi:MAG: substrate-binding domain-containing protein [Nocardiopsaceae bacterium]|nr:substrate-binding domain-containing protein [Nocardiopsaceae bacterium]
MRIVLSIVCAGLLAAVAGCGGSSPSQSSGASSSSSASASASPGAKVSGTANVAYASSLEYLNEKMASPAFKSATGAGYSGTGNTSGTLEQEILSGEISPNVFEAVGGDNITPLEPKFTKWYVQYAGTSMVLAYNPKSKYASQFEAIANGKKPMKDLFTLLQTPGLKLGRTDPATDPQGRDFIMMLELAQSYYHLPGDTVSKILGTSDLASSDSSEIYAESSLDSTLQSGQLDASSAFISQAVQLHLHYIKLPTAIDLGSFSDAAQYKKASLTVAGKTYHGEPQVIDITTIGTPTPASEAFVAYTLSPAGLATYKKGGFSMIKPTLFGDKSAVPKPILSELGG